MFLKRKLWFIIYSLVSLYATSLFAQQKYKLSVIRTVEPVTTITWNKEGTNFGYAERNSIVVRTPERNALIQQIATETEDIKLLKYASNTQGLNKDVIAALHKNGQFDFRVLPDTAASISQKLEIGEPTIITCSDDGSYYAIGSKKGIVFLFKMDYANKKATALQVGNFALPITALTFSRDNKYLLIGAADNSVTKVEVATRKIENGYAYNAKNKVPILMTADSKSIIMTTGDSTIGFFDLDFNRYNYYTTYRDILSMHISADNRFLIILTDDNIFSYYDMRTHELKKYIPAFNETKILTYSFNPDCSKVAVSHEDGSLYVLDVKSVICEMDEARKDFSMTEFTETMEELNFTPPQPNIPEQDIAVAPIVEEEPEPVVEEPVEIQPIQQVEPEPEPEPVEELPVEEPEPEPIPEPVEELPVEEPEILLEPEPEPEVKEPVVVEEKKEPKKKEPFFDSFKDIREYKDEDIIMKYKNGHGLLVNIGWTLLDDPYTFELSMPIGYRNYNLIKPFYFGGSIETSIGFPTYEFPYTYYLNGSFLESPKMMGLKVLAPFGFCMFPLKNDLEVFAEINLGVSMHGLWDGRFGSTSIVGSVFPAFYGSITVGAAWNIVSLSIAAAYDAILGIKFKAQAGVIINIGGVRRFITFNSMADIHRERTEVKEEDTKKK